MTRRFELTDAKSNKFWEITTSGKTVSVRYGRIGTDGQTQSKAYAAVKDAETAAEKQIAEKVKKGYIEIREAAGAQPPANSPSIADSKSARPKKAPAKKASAGVLASKNAFDKEQLDALHRLLTQDDTDAVMQGIALLRSINDPGLWAHLADGLRVGNGGRIEVAKGKQGGVRYSPLAALWILASGGRLKTVPRLDLSGSKGLQNLTALHGLSKLQTLNLSDCKELESLEGISGCTELKELILSGCTALKSLEGVNACQGLERLELYAETRDSWDPELQLVEDLWAQELIHDVGGRLPLAMTQNGGDGEWDTSEEIELTFAKLREYLGLPRLEVVFLREPNHEEQHYAKRDGWAWDSEARRWTEVDAEDEDNDDSSYWDDEE